MDGLLQELVKSVSSLTFRRTAVVLILSLAVLWGFERYSASFRLARIERASEILKELQEIEAKGIGQSPTLNEAYKSLVGEYRKVVDEKPPDIAFISPQITSQMFWKFFAGSFLWVLILFRAIFREKDPGIYIQSVFGVILCGFVFGLIGMLLPTNPWLNYLIYPVFHIVIVVIFTYAISINILMKKLEKSDLADSNENNVRS